MRGDAAVACDTGGASSYAYIYAAMRQDVVVGVSTRKKWSGNSTVSPTGSGGPGDGWGSVSEVHMYIFYRL